LAGEMALAFKDIVCFEWLSFLDFFS
jgi:hypothetical protein